MTLYAEKGINKYMQVNAFTKGQLHYAKFFQTFLCTDFDPKF